MAEIKMESKVVESKLVRNETEPCKLLEFKVYQYMKDSLNIHVDEIFNPKQRTEKRKIIQSDLHVIRITLPRQEFCRLPGCDSQYDMTLQHLDWSPAIYVVPPEPMNPYWMIPDNGYDGQGIYTKCDQNRKGQYPFIPEIGILYETCTLCGHVTNHDLVSACPNKSICGVSACSTCASSWTCYQSSTDSHYCSSRCMPIASPPCLSLDCPNDSPHVH